MTVKDWAIPVATVVFAAGVSFASLESAAQEAEDLSKRVTVLEPSIKPRSVLLLMRVATNETCTA